VERGVQGIERDTGGAQLSVGWLDGIPELGDQSLERAAAYAAILTRTLVAAGYQPRRLEVGLRRGAHRILEFTVRGDVPRMAEPAFIRLARVTLNAARLAQDIDGTHDVLFSATLETIVADTAQSLQPTTSAGLLRSFPFGRLAAALVLGQLKQVLDSYASHDLNKALAVWKGDEEIDAMCTSLFRELLTYMMEDPRNITFCIHLMFCAKNIERMGDHATNIAETVYYMIEGRALADERPKGDTTSFATLAMEK